MSVGIKRFQISRFLVFAWIIAAALLVICLGEILLTRDAQARRPAAGLTFPVVNLVAALGLGLGFLHSKKVSTRLAWAWGILCLAQVVFTLGDIFWAILVVGAGQPPFPSVADVFYTLYYPLVMAGILLMPGRRHTPDDALKRALDIGIIVIASILIFWNFFVGPAEAAAPGETLLAKIVAQAYPTGDLLMLWSLLVLLHHRVDSQSEPPLLLLGLAAVVMIVTDVFFYLLFLQGTYTRGGLLDIGWILSCLLFGMAGVYQALSTDRLNPGTAWRIHTEWLRQFMQFTPYLWIAGAFLLLVRSHLAPLAMDFVWIAAGVALGIALVMVRQATVISENQNLFSQLNQALARVQEQAAELEMTNRELTEEISQRERMAQQLAHDALYDALTGLPNRALFMDRLGHSIEYARRYPDFYFSVLFLDLDQFKLINDSLGHTSGDQLLVGTAQRLTHCVRASDTVARLGGDEFVILLEDTRGDEPATEAIRRIREALAAPFELQGHEVVTTASVGIVTRLSASAQPAEILRDADIAMYQAKLLGKNGYVLFSPELRTQAMSRLQLENDLRHGLERNEFELYYQPIFSLVSDRIVGFEALLRWKHPRRGLVMPGDFIPVAEESGLILGIGQWVLRQACERMSQWRRQIPGAECLTINVNISSKQFAQGNFVEQVEQVIRETGFPPEALKLEITESVVIDNQAHANLVFDRLSRLGVKMQMDDFGTGYSALSYLQNFPIQAIKIDRSFIQEIGRLGKNPDLVRSILRMARDLGMSAIAEGVETPEQLAILKELSCAFGQGFYLARPVDEQMAARLLERTWLPVLETA